MSSSVILRNARQSKYFVVGDLQWRRRDPHARGFGTEPVADIAQRNLETQAQLLSHGRSGVQAFG